MKSSAFPARPWHWLGLLRTSPAARVALAQRSAKRRRSLSSKISAVRAANSPMPGAPWHHWTRGTVRIARPAIPADAAIVFQRDRLDPSPDVVYEAPNSVAAGKPPKLRQRVGNAAGAVHEPGAEADLTVAMPVPARPLVIAIRPFGRCGHRPSPRHRAGSDPLRPGTGAAERSRCRLIRSAHARPARTREPPRGPAPARPAASVRARWLRTGADTSGRGPTGRSTGRRRR